MGENLNTLMINTDNKPERLQDYSTKYISSDVSVIFRKQKEILIEKISNYNFVVGCVAWLTDFDIIDALTRVEKVSIIVQKEDFLRPDIGSTADWKIKLRKAYSRVKNSEDRGSWPGLIGNLSVNGDPTIEAIRCVGNHNKEKRPAFPRMHNKFLVFGNCIIPDYETEYQLKVSFKEIWTGSFNFTANANNSFENVVMIKNNEVAEAYYNEFCQIFALSESLDWESNWCEPDYRIGT